MATSKQKKRRRNQARSEGFYETLPMTSFMMPLAPPVTTPRQALAALREPSELSHTLRAYTANAAAYTKGGLFDVGNAAWWLLRRLTGYRARAIYISLIASSALAGTVLISREAQAVVSQYNSDMSSPAVIITKKKVGITLTDRNGTVLYETSGQGSSSLVDLKTLPANFKNATLAAEDLTFYLHDGFSIKSMVRAAYVDITHGGAVEGGSTLTQQLIKNALLTSNKTFVRKFQELVLANTIEQRYTKDQILSMYMSEVPYGQNTFGVEQAAQTYFHIPASQMTLAQSALLAGLPQATTNLDPTVYPEAAKARRDYVLGRMAELGMVTTTEATAAEAEPITASQRNVKILAPHFVFYVLDQLKAQYGDDVLNEGRTVTTSLDLGKQDLAQATVTKQINALAKNNATNGGLISLDPKNGDILAMVGSTDYNQPDFGAVNVTLSELQPGSSFKPFAYVTAFEKGWTGATHVDDVAVSFPDGASTYTPQNYDLKFRGPVSLRYALANSLNIPAIKVLQYATIADTIKTAKSLGVTSLNQPGRYGLSLVLGGAEVSPIDMATAYGAFATAGTKVTPRSIIKITDKLGAATYTAPTKVTGSRVIDPKYTYMISSILSDNTARTPDFGPNSPLKLTRPSAAKTGTTNDFRDNWTVGYTPDLVTAVWVGNNNHSAMQGVTGITGAAPIWHDYMQGALAQTNASDFVVPTGITMAKISTNGCLVNAGDASGVTEVFVSTALPTPCNSAPQTQPSQTTPTQDSQQVTTGGVTAPIPRTPVQSPR